MDSFNSELADSFSAHCGRTFLVDHSTGDSLTFREFACRIGAVWAFLQAWGVKPGEVVSIISENSSDLAAGIYGILSYGAIAMPVNPKLTLREMETLIIHSECRLAVMESFSAPRVGEAIAVDLKSCLAGGSMGFPQVMEGLRKKRSGGLLIYTSGTTGNPKGVCLSGANIFHNLKVARIAFRLDDRHVKLCILPLFHTFGFISDLSTMAFCGGKVVIQRTFDLARIADLGEAIRVHGVNSFSAVPLIFDMLLRMEADLGDGSLAFCVSGAAPLDERIRLGFRERFGVDIIPAYGLTECTCFCTISPTESITPGSVGRAAGVEIMVLDEEERPMPPLETGEICVRGASVFAGGYFRSDFPCYAAGDPDLFKTGDLGYIDSSGNVFVTGRKKNMVIRGGEKVYLEDVDRCLRDCGGVRDAASVKAGDGEVEPIVSFIVPEAPGLDIAEVRRLLIERIGPQKCPDRFIVTDSIPRTPTNKVRIRELQAVAGKGA